MASAGDDARLSLLEVSIGHGPVTRRVSRWGYILAVNVKPLEAALWEIRMWNVSV